MEKLISLLNKYEMEREKGIEEFKNWTLPLWERYLCQWELAYEPAENFFNWETLIWDSANSVVISKHYGFIKWLVDNDKIDDEENNKINRRKVCWEDKHWEFRICKLYINCAETEEDLDVELFDDYERLLMHLAIQDEPIEFLCSILK